MNPSTRFTGFVTERSLLKWATFNSSTRITRIRKFRTFVAFPTDVSIPLQQSGDLRAKRRGQLEPFTGAKIFAGGPLTEHLSVQSSPHSRRELK